MTAHARRQVDLPAAAGGGDEAQHGPLGALFAEELGLLLEVAPEQEAGVRAAYQDQGLDAVPIGRVGGGRAVSIAVAGEPCISGACAKRQTRVMVTLWQPLQADTS